MRAFTLDVIIVFWLHYGSPYEVQTEENIEGFNLGEYHDHDELNDYIRELADYCDVCQTVAIGTSFEEREMLALQIGDHSNGKQGIWIDAGMHAREWVAPATAVFLANMLVGAGPSNSTNDAHALRAAYVWYILPSANPDGYMYSWYDDRMWKKTRQWNAGSWLCDGRDPNSNWDFHWGETDSGSHPCSEMYFGPHAFSEPETKAIADFILAKQGQILMYLSFHSYGQYWLIPWGYTSSTIPPDYFELMRVGLIAVDAIRGLTNRHYQFGSYNNVLYPASGMSADWAKGVAGIRYSYTVILPDTGLYNFLLPPERIIPTGLEIWTALVAMVPELQATY